MNNMEDEIEQDDMKLSISEVSKLTGITPSNLRFFESEGLLEIPRDGSGRRVYTRRAMSELAAVICMKKTGMDLKDLKHFFQLVREGEDSLHERYQMLKDHYESILQRLDELEKIRNYSKIKMDYIGQCCEAYEKGLPAPKLDPAYLNSFLQQIQNMQH